MTREHLLTVALPDEFLETLAERVAELVREQTIEANLRGSPWLDFECAEASRYLAVLATFQELHADPHAEARMRAARAREYENEVRRRQAATKKRGICRWTS